MSEDAFVRMLLESANGTVIDERDVHLARAAAAWALRHGWRPYPSPGDGFIAGRQGLEFWIDDTPSRDALTIMTRLQPGTGWRHHGRYPVAHLGHALDVLAAEQLLPARYSPLGRATLEDHAEILDRAAAHLLRGKPSDRIIERAFGLSEAADSARRYAAGDSTPVPPRRRRRGGAGTGVAVPA